MEGFSYSDPNYLSSLLLYLNKENECLYRNTSQGAEVRAYQISSSANDPFHCTSSSKNENTGFLAIAPKPSPTLRSILPENVTPSITPRTLTRMYETRPDTNVHFPEKQDCPPLTWQSFGSGFPMLLYQNNDNELLYVNESQGAEERVYQISSSSNDPFHYTSLSSAKNENTGFLPIAPKPSPALRSVLLANVTSSITPQTLETSTRMYETRPDTNVHFPEKQDGPPLTWESFRSGFPMVLYQNKDNELLYVNESQGAERRVYQISSSSNDPFHYTSLKNETGFLPIAPKQSDALRSIIPANVMPSITPQTLETPTKMYETRLDTNVHFPKKQDCLPLNWGSFPSGFPMMDYGPIYTCNNNTIFQPQSDIQEDKQLVITGKQASRWDLKSKKPCNCTKSQCLKLYCDCFANCEFCNNCNCNKCCNNLGNKEKCFKAIRTCLDKNPKAFQRKISKSKTEDLKPKHSKGCKCKRSGCLKNYCECYEAKIMCSSNCKCIRCKNVEESPDRKTLRSIQKQQDAECFYSVFTSPDVVRAAATCLLAQVEKAEEEKQSVGIAEKMIIEEFGNCLSQMLQTDIQRYQ